MADTNILDKQVENKERDENGRLLPGHTANPNGRPKKGQALTDLMREMMEEQPEIKKAIMARLMKGAAEGDIAFIREVLDRIEGKPLQKNENTTITDLQLSYGHTKPDESSAKTGDSDTTTT